WPELQADEAEAWGRWSASIFHLGRLIQREPSSATWRYRRGNAYAELGKWTDAVADFTAAALQRPNDVGVQYGHGLALLAQHDSLVLACHGTSLLGMLVSAAGSPWSAMGGMTTLVRTGPVDYAKTCRAMVDRLGEASAVSDMNSAIWLTVLDPQS